MNFEKMKIKPLKKEGNKLVPDEQKAIEVLFNPNTYTITKTVTWSTARTSENSDNNSNASNNQYNAPPLTFGGGASRHLRMDLFFDVTEPVNGQIKPIDDVRILTDEIVKLTRIDKKNPPPVCEVNWGNKNKTEDFPFIGVIVNLTQRFTMFRENGNPVRATLTVDFLEFLDPELDKRQTDPEQTTHIVKRGETLSSISGKLYHDPTLWRIIAEFNHVDDPRRLIVGQTLTIPKYGNL